MSQPYLYASAANCIAHLRKLGCEIDADAEQRMLDESRVHHLLAVQMKRVVEECREYYCTNGHPRLVVFKRPRRKMKKGSGSTACEVCGAPWTGGWRAVWWRLFDGSVADNRRDIERMDQYADPEVYRAQ